MREHLGIRFGNKYIAALLEHSFKFNIILDYTVVHKRYSAVSALMRMCIDICRRTVGGPSCMTYSDRAGKTADLFELFLKIFYTALCLNNVCFAVF